MQLSWPGFTNSSFNLVRYEKYISVVLKYATAILNAIHQLLLNYIMAGMVIVPY
jgi:hypothetical protein